MRDAQAARRDAPSAAGAARILRADGRGRISYRKGTKNRACSDRFAWNGLPANSQHKPARMMEIRQPRRMRKRPVGQTLGVFDHGAKRELQLAIAWRLRQRI